ncbi:MAG: hypothetical protein ACTIN8_00345 [Pseudolactococcus laudensis]
MYKQLIMPLVATSAIASYCLLYVDNTINVPSQYRTANAQVAHDTAKQKGWVYANTDYPKNVWFVMFWSIDNGDYQGQGHVALAFVDDAGSIQIHDSEVHRGAREVYTNFEDFYNWFGSVGIQMTYLGWGEGVDGVKLLEKVEPVAQPKPVEAETKKEDKTNKAKKEKKELWKVYAFQFSFSKDKIFKDNFFEND